MTVCVRITINLNRYASLMSIPVLEQSVMAVVMWLHEMRSLIVDQIGFGRDLLVLVSIDVI